jgi:hypothetical protein
LIPSAGRKYSIYPDQSGTPFPYPTGTGDKVNKSMKLTTQLNLLTRFGMLGVLPPHLLNTCMALCLGRGQLYLLKRTLLINRKKEF